MEMARFPIIIEEEDDGFVVECPAFEGCYTEGDTYEEALDNIRDLIRLHLERGAPAHVNASLSVGSVEIEA